LRSQHQQRQHQLCKVNFFVDKLDIRVDLTCLAKRIDLEAISDDLLLLLFVVVILNL